MSGVAMKMAWISATLAVVVLALLILTGSWS
jgi:hypothetical protein